MAQGDQIQQSQTVQGDHLWRGTIHSVSGQLDPCSPLQIFILNFMSRRGGVGLAGQTSRQVYWSYVDTLSSLLSTRLHLQAHMVFDT